MALNLSTLTNSATSGTVLAEALTTADFLDPVPILKNLARGSQKGGDAKQTTGLNQPRALPLIKNPAGNLGGYLYIPNVSNNYATGPSVTIGSNETWEGELDMVITQWGSHLTPMGGGYWSNGFGLVFYTSGAVRLFSKASGAATVSSGVTLGTPFNVKYGFDGSAIYVDIDGARVYSDSSSGIVSLQSGSITHTLELNQQANIGNVGNYAIQKAKLTVNSAVVFDCDFNGSTSIRHGDTKFNCVGGPVSLIKVGNDPVTVVKKGVLRFDGADDFMKGVFNQTINDGYMFAAFSVLGNGGDTSGRVFSISSTGITDSGSRSAVFSQTEGTRTDLQSFYNGNTLNIQSNLFDESNGDILHESLIKNGSQKAGVNNANFLNTSLSTSIESEEFNISCNPTAVSARNTAIDLEFLALFSADSVPDEATATKIRDYINKRNKVFDNDPNLLEFEPAAAYSLRSFDANADPNVVNVRRSSDGATSDFTASDVSDGTLRDWVNTDVDLVTPTLNNGGFEDGLAGWGSWSASADTNEFYTGTQSAKITVIGGGGAYIYKANLEVGSSYRVGFWAKISDSSKQARVEFGSASNREDISFTSTDWEYKEVTKTATAGILAFARQTGSGDYTVNFDNITVTQLTSDGHVTTWYDQGGTNHAAQATASKQPKIVDGGTLVTDGSGSPAIVGDGVDDTLFHPTLTQSLDNTDFLVSAVYENSLALGVSGGVPRLYMTQAAMSYNTLNTISFSNQSGRNVLSFQTNGDAQEVFGNGTSLGTGSEAQANFSYNSFHLMQAGSGFSNGFLMEVIVYNKAISTADRLSFENGINKYYNIF